MNLDHDKSNLLFNSVTCDFFLNERLTKVLKKFVQGILSTKCFFFKDDLGHYMGVFQHTILTAFSICQLFPFFNVCSNQ